MAEVRIVPFNQLPRATRERFVAITKNLAGPTPIFSQRTGGGGIAGWIVLIVVMLGLTGVLLTTNFGSVWHATQPPVTIAMYGVFFFFVLFGVLGLVRSVRTSKAIPFAAGVYVFPMDLVIARDNTLKIVPMSELASLQPTHHFRNGIYMRTTFAFRFSDGTIEMFSCFGQPQAQMLMERLKAATAETGDAITRRDVSALQALDPFFEPRMNGWQPAIEPPAPPLAMAIPRWMRMGWVFALVGSVVLAPIGWGLRNLGSDASAFSSAKRWDSSSGYQDYLESGWLHRDEVRAELMPRALLKEANAKKDVNERIQAIQAVIDAHPTGSVRPDADKSMKDAVHAAFLDAKSLSTVAALRDFQKKFPKADDVPNAKARIHELFQKTLADFKPRAAKSDQAMVPFVESLLAYMEANDSPAMEVRFRRHNSPSLAVADKILADEEGGDVAAVSGHFDASDSAPREKAVVSAMQNGFAKVFPTDVLPLAQGSDFDTVTKAAVVTKPTILVDYTVGWSGSQYVDKVEGRRFVGVIIEFDVLMVTPNDATRKLELRFSVRPPQRFTVGFNSDPAFKDLVKDGPSDSQVYEVMALRAFDELSTKIQDKFFQPQKKAAPAKPDDDE